MAWLFFWLGFCESGNWQRVWVLWGGNWREKEVCAEDQTVKPTQKLHKIKENVATLVGIFFGFPFSKLK